jgi:hypothetical protein
VGKDYLRDTIGQGVAVIDVDDDGRFDLVFPQGMTGDGSASDDDGRDLLYLNLGHDSGHDSGDQLGDGQGGRFEEQGRERGLDARGYGFGALAFDQDGDGDEDLFITNLGPDVLYRNDGGSFTQVTDRHPGLAGPAEEWSVGAAAGDVDGDGDLDLYVARYCAQDLADLDAQGPTMFMGCLVPRGPIGLPAQADRFYRNDDGRLVEHTDAAGLADVDASYGFQPAFTDVDADGDLDLYVTNDSVFNFLFMNDGAGHFSESALRAGVACGRRGQMEAGMGLAVADVDGDGLPELHVTNFSNQDNSFYRNQTTAPDDPWFLEAGELAGVSRPSWFRLAWGTSFADFDADGHQDLFVANGHIYHHVEGCAPERITYRQPNHLFRGDGMRFTDVSESAGGPFTAAASHRGSAVVDVDGDGDLDLVVNRLDERPLLAINVSPVPGHHLVLDVRRRLVAGGPLVRAVGVAARLTAGSFHASRELQAGSSFLGTEDPRLVFGLGAATAVDRLVLRVPGGAPVTLHDLPVDALVRVVLEPDGTASWSRED